MPIKILFLAFLLLSFNCFADSAPTKVPAPNSMIPTIPPDMGSAYEEVLEGALQALVNDEPDQFKSFLSDSMIKRTEEHYGAGSVDKIIKERFIPFFYDFKSLDPNVTTTTTTDADGNSGMAFFRTFLAEDGAQKAFVFYIVQEKDKLRVANVLIDKTFREVIKSAGR